MPRWAQSIRFRLSLAYALAVFTAGTVLVVGLYLWQVRQLDQPILLETQVVTVVNPTTLEPFDYTYFVSDAELIRYYLIDFERQAYRQSLNELRRASLVGLGILFVVAFGSGWVLAGWSLRPLGRMAAVARDISGTELSRRISLDGPDDELRDLANTFDAMLDRLQTSFEQQRQFVQDTSHELRNPLAIARTNLELVIDDPEADTDQLREAAQLAYESTGRVAGVVDQLVDQARQRLPLGSGPAELNRLVDLDHLADEVLAELAATASARSLTLTADHRAAPVEVRGDAAGLHRALTNLVTNAVRLAPEGSVVAIVVDRAADGMASISVVDQGPGIAPDEQQVVFERFQRGQAPGGPGLGLGLNIVRQIAERHGGRVELHSEVGVGSTFTLLVPTPISS